MTAYAGLTTAAAHALEPLREALRDPLRCRQLLERLGFPGPVSGSTLARLNELAPLLGALEQISELVADARDGELSAPTLGRLVPLIGEVASAIDALGAVSHEGLTGLPAALATSEGWADLAKALPDLLLADWLEEELPILLGILRMTGVCVPEHRARSRRDRFRWDRLPQLLTDPARAVLDTFEWGTSFRAWPFQRVLGRALANIGLPVRHRMRQPSVVEIMADGSSTQAGSGVESDVIFVRGRTASGNRVEVGLVFSSSSEAGGTLFVGNLISGELSGSVPVASDWSLEARGAIDGTATMGVLIRAGQIGIVGGTPVLQAGLSLLGEPSAPWILCGSATGTRLELSQLAIDMGIEGSVDAPDPYLVFRVAAGGLRFVLDLGAADAFLRGVIGDQAPEIACGGALRWSARDGISFEGGLGLSLEVPLDLSLGPLHVSRLACSLSGGAGGARLAVTTTAELRIGPIFCSVENVGAALELSVPAQRTGLFGLDAELVFVPPTVLGLSVDAGPVSGGGYLDIDSDKGEYSGALELDLFGVGVTAVGIITTRLPDGSEGWSMFLSLSATFKGLQLGFGFTLNGVGGLVGIHRGLDEDALADGVRSGALESILFPKDVIANAPRILADMAAVFPPARDQFVLGPCELGWGTPTLIEGDLGVVIQLPEPLTVTILGAIAAVLPDEDAPILELRVDIAGTLNLTEGTLKVDASLTDSRVAGMALSGDMAIRASFADDPSFLFSFGGFHPAFTPPRDFPKLARLGIGLDTGEHLRISLSSYFAITSNTLQLGAQCAIFISAVGFTAEGGTSFDALLVFKPFGFTISMKAWVSISAGKQELFSVLLKGRLQGPNPWFVAGVATFRLLGFKQSLDVEASFGRTEAEAPREIIDVGALLLAALRDPKAWSPLPPAGGTMGVVFAEETGSALQVHPAGGLQVRQRIAPLGRRIDHYGHATLQGASEFVLTKPRVGTTDVDVVEVDDWFAAAQYWDVSEAERLAAPSFEAMSAGVRFQSARVSAGGGVTLTADYEVKYRDPAGRHGVSSALGPSATARIVRSRGQGASLSAGLPKGEPLASGRGRGGLSVAEVKFVEVNRQTGERATPGAREGGFFAARERVRRGPKPDSMSVVPAYELELE